MNKKVRRFGVFVTAAIVCFVTLFAPVTVAADITLPEEFYGDITFNGLAAPAGTVIAARIDTLPRGSFTTTEAGKYGGATTFALRLSVSGTNTEIGKTITFWVSGVKASQSASYKPGQTNQLALSFQPYPLNVSDIQITKALNYLRGAQQPDGSIGGYVASGWAVMAIAAAGQNPNSWSVGGNSIVSYLKNNAAANLDPNKATDWERSILTLVAAGENPRAFGGLNYVDKVLGFYNGNQIGEATMLNDDVWGILALSSIGEGQPVIPNARNFIVSKQNTDGGWSWAVGGASDADNTAAATIALIAAGEPSGSPVMAKAIGYLKTQQQMNGGFTSEGTTNSAVDSWVIGAINALGQSPIADAWQKSGNSAVSHLLSLQNTDGSFKWTASQPTNPVWMTAYAIPALLGKPYPRGFIGTGDIRPCTIFGGKCGHCESAYQCRLRGCCLGD